MFPAAGRPKVPVLGGGNGLRPYGLAYEYDVVSSDDEDRDDDSKPPEVFKKITDKMLMDSQNAGNADCHMKIMDELVMETFNAGIVFVELDDIIDKVPGYYPELEFENLERLDEKFDKYEDMVEDAKMVRCAVRENMNDLKRGLRPPAQEQTQSANDEVEDNALAPETSASAASHVIGEPDARTVTSPSTGTSSGDLGSGKCSIGECALPSPRPSTGSIPSATEESSDEVGYDVEQRSVVAACISRISPPSARLPERFRTRTSTENMTSSHDPCGRSSDCSFKDDGSVSSSATRGSCAPGASSRELAHRIGGASASVSAAGAPPESGKAPAWSPHARNTGRFGFSSVRSSGVRGILISNSRGVVKVPRKGKRVTFSPIVSTATIYSSGVASTSSDQPDPPPTVRSAGTTHSALSLEGQHLIFGSSSEGEDETPDERKEEEEGFVEEQKVEEPNNPDISCPLYREIDMGGFKRTLDSLGQRLQQTDAVATASKTALEAVYIKYDSLRDRAVQDEAALQKRIENLEEDLGNAQSSKEVTAKMLARQIESTESARKERSDVKKALTESQQENTELRARLAEHGIVAQRVAAAEEKSASMEIENARLLALVAAMEGEREVEKEAAEETRVRAETAVAAATAAHEAKTKAESKLAERGQAEDTSDHVERLQAEVARLRAKVAATNARLESTSAAFCEVKAKLEEASDSAAEREVMHVSELVAVRADMERLLDDRMAAGNAPQGSSVEGQSAAQLATVQDSVAQGIAAQERTSAGSVGPRGVSITSRVGMVDQQGVGVTSQLLPNRTRQMMRLAALREQHGGHNGEAGADQSAAAGERLAGGEMDKSLTVSGGIVGVRAPLSTVRNSNNRDGIRNLDVGREGAQRFLESGRKRSSGVRYGIARNMAARPLLSDEDREAFLNRVEQDVRSRVYNTMRATNGVADVHQR